MKVLIAQAPSTEEFCPNTKTNYLSKNQQKKRWKKYTMVNIYYGISLIWIGGKRDHYKRLYGEMLTGTTSCSAWTNLGPFRSYVKHWR